MNRQSAHGLKLVVGTRFYLFCPTSSWAYWRKPSPLQRGELFSKDLKTQDPQTSGTSALQTSSQHRSGSQFLCQATAFVCLLCNHNRPTEPTHPPPPWSSSEEGDGSPRTVQATQSPLCVSDTKGAVRVKKWDVWNCAGSQVRPTCSSGPEGNSSLVTGFQRNMAHPHVKSSAVSVSSLAGGLNGRCDS